MKRPRRRVAVLIAATAALLGLAAQPASATADYVPSDADFEDCPTLPAGATGVWKCHVMTAEDTLVGTSLGRMHAHTKYPVRLTIAQGRLSDGRTVAKLGGLRAEPIPFVTGVPGTQWEVPHPTGWKLEVTPTGLVEPGALVPHTVGLTARIIGDGLGDSCRIGSVSKPIVIEPVVDWALPWMSGGTLVTRMKVADITYALGVATGCNGHDFTVNEILGLPANAASNQFVATWQYRSKRY